MPDAKGSEDKRGATMWATFVRRIYRDHGLETALDLIEHIEAEAQALGLVSQPTEVPRPPEN